MPLILFLRLRKEKHVPRKVTVPRKFRDHTDRHPIRRIGSRKTVLDEHITPLQEPLEATEELIELVAAERPVVFPPPNAPFGACFAHDELVRCGARCVFSRVRDDGTAPRDTRLAPESNFFVKRFGRQVPVCHAQVGQAMVLQAVVASQCARFPLGGG